MMTLNRLIYGLVLAFPVVLLAVKPLAMIIFAILSIIGIFIAIRERKNPFKMDTLKLFSWLTIGYFSVMVVSVLLSNEATNSWTHLSRVSHFLFAPFVAVSVMKASVSFEVLSKSFKMGVIIAGLISIIGFIVAGGVGRFSGMYNPNTFGDLAVMLLFFSIINVSKESKSSYNFSLIAVFFGVSAIVLSGSRGSIITLIFLTILYMVVMLRFSGHSRKKIWSIVIFLAIILGMNILVFGNNTIHRLSTIKKDVGQWEGERRTTSVGQRMEMYIAGGKAFLDSPFIGYGYHNCGTAAARYASQDPTIQKKFEDRWHLHNEFLTTIVNAGLLGLISLLFLFLIPLFSFMRNMNSSIYAIMGIILISGYIFLGMTHTLFGYEYETAFFVFILAYIFTRISSKDIINV